MHAPLQRFKLEAHAEWPFHVFSEWHISQSQFIHKSQYQKNLHVKRR
jgi:hypothetical protein